MFVNRYGRVNFVLAQRIELLQEVSRLEKSLGVTEENAYTCETAGYFYIYQVSFWKRNKFYVIIAVFFNFFCLKSV